MAENDNYPSAEYLAALHHKLTLQEEKKAEAQRKMSALRKQAKARGIKLGNLDKIRRELRADDTQFIEDLAEQQRLAKAFSLPIGTQFTLIDEFDATDRQDMAKARGYKAGVNGVSNTENPHDPSSKEGQLWLEGWNDGQRVLAAGLKQLDEEEAKAAAADEAEEKDEAA